MRLVIHPPVEAERLQRLTAAAAPMQVVNAASAEEAAATLTNAEAFFGKITPPLLAGAARRRSPFPVSVALPPAGWRSKVLSTAFRSLQPQPNRVPARRDLQGPRPHLPIC